MLNDKMDDAPRVSGKRLWSRLMAMAEIGATAHGGCNRQALTDGDFKGRELFARWAQDAGCSIRVDAIGNLFARRPGSDPGLPVVMTGSHLDTQPTGGKFDGVYGVLAGLEVLESLNDRAIRTRHPLEIAVWCNEEGCRFPAAMMGSAVWAGRMALESAYTLQDRDGRSVREELERGGVALSASLERQPVKAAFELHIEQGPVLEQRAKSIGVVTGVQYMSRHEVTALGQEAHAGPTPMDMRRDPIRALADILPAIYAAASKCGPQARLTVAMIETRPSSANTVPGFLRFFIDLRHPDGGQYRALRTQVEGIVETALARHRLGGGIS
jgi:beta-ureidopropionase / N-carbamoyl-L-amino-acid hydrolase